MLSTYTMTMQSVCSQLNTSDLCLTIPLSTLIKERGKRLERNPSQTQFESVTIDFLSSVQTVATIPYHKSYMYIVLNIILKNNMRSLYRLFFHIVIFKIVFCYL